MKRSLSFDKILSTLAMNFQINVPPVIKLCGTLDNDVENEKQNAK